MIPDSRVTATRAATSLPSACDATRIAEGDSDLATCASASAAAGTPHDAKSADSTTSTFAIGPWLTVAASAVPAPGAASTTAVTSPIRAPAVASSAVVLDALSP